MQFMLLGYFAAAIFKPAGLCSTEVAKALCELLSRSVCMEVC